jgi:hypothetical protein
MLDPENNPFGNDFGGLITGELDDGTDALLPPSRVQPEQRVRKGLSRSHCIKFVLVKTHTLGLMRPLKGVLR